MKNRKYTDEFKQQAVKLAAELGNTTAAAKQLGIGDAIIHSWAKKFNAMTGEKMKPVLPSDAEENKRLKKENEELKKVNYILKRAAAFFSQDHLK